jgi:hypothetical protein
LLPRLIDADCLLGLVTGNVEGAAHVKLHRGQLNRFFSFGGYGSDSTDRAELTRIAVQRGNLVYSEPLSPEQAIVVGDTPTMSPRPTRPGSSASASAATTSPPISSAKPAPTTRSPRSRKGYRSDVPPAVALAVTPARAGLRMRSSSPSRGQAAHRGGSR